MILLRGLLTLFGPPRVVAPEGPSLSFLTCSICGCYASGMLRKRSCCLLLVIFLAGSLRAEPLEVRVGLLTELSGPSASNGERCRQGFEVAHRMYAAELQAQHVVLRTFVEDHAGDAKVGVAAFQKLIDQDQIVVALATRSQVSMALNPISLERQIPLLGTVGHPGFTTQNRFAFRTYPSVDQEAAALVAALRHDKLLRLATLSIEDEWNKSLAAAVEDHLKGAGGRVVFSESMLPNDPDPRAFSGRLRMAQPEAIFINLALGSSGVAMKRLRELGLPQPFFSNFWGAAPESLQVAGHDASAGMRYVTINTQKPRFREAVLTAFPEASVAAVTYSCFAGVRWLIDAILISAREGHKFSAEELAPVLTKVTEMELPDEHLSVSGRELQFDLAVERVP